MKTKFLVAILTVLVVVSVVSATMLIPANDNDNAKENTEALENSPVIGENWALEPNGLIRVDLIHYAKPDNSGKPAKTETCYKLFGIKWKTLPVSYVINPTNPQGLPAKFVTSAISASAETWDAATSSELFNDAYTIDYNVWWGVYDYKNAISFGNYSQENVIAVTSYWRNPRTKAIVEFDIMFDTDWVWGNADINPGVMDLQNIATHELGHGVGLADVYSTTCSAVTMYGYSWYGDIDGRTLEQPDITGLQKLYG